MRLNLKPMQIDILKLYFKKLDQALGIEPITPEHLKKSFNQKLDKLTKGKQWKRATYTDNKSKHIRPQN